MRDGLRPIEEIEGDDAEDTALLREMAARARSYIQSFDWCPPITSAHFGIGIGGIVAVFIFEFLYKIKGTDDRLWVIVGDLPSAYLVTDEIESPVEALDAYCDLMDEWAGAVETPTDLTDVFPVAVEPTIEHARMLRARTQFLRREIVDLEK